MTVANAMQFGLSLQRRGDSWLVLHRGAFKGARRNPCDALGLLRMFAVIISQHGTTRLA